MTKFNYIKDNIIKYFIIYFGIFTSLLILDVFYEFLKIEGDLGLKNLLEFHALFSLFISFIILLFYVITFNVIFNIKVKNYTLYFLIIFLTFLMGLGDTLSTLEIWNMPSSLLIFFLFGSFPIGFLLYGVIFRYSQNKQ